MTRGSTEKAVRAVYEVPAEKNFVVGDIEVDDQKTKIEFGGQIADRISIKLTGLATRMGTISATPVGCVHEIAKVEAAVAGTPSVDQVIGEVLLSSHR